MIYTFIVKPLVRIFNRIFFRMQISGLDRIPEGKPIVFIPNHVNGFVDPVVVGMLMKEKVRFFARGDVFKGTLAKWFLEKMNISPVYRMSEGYSDVKKNDVTFDECRRLLGEKKMILLFPEGICIQDRRINKLKKGLARILLGIEDSFENKEDILIIPVGLNYSDPKHFGSKLFILFGTPFHVQDFHALYKLDKVRAINTCTQFMEEKMKELIVHLDDEQQDALYEALVEIYSRQWMQEENKNPRDLEAGHKKNKLLGSLVNRLGKEYPLKLEELKSEVLPYLADVRSHNLRDHLLRQDTLSKISIRSSVNDFLMLWFGLPVYWIGRLLNWLPYKFAGDLAVKKAKFVEFHASIQSNAGMLLWIIYFLLQICAVQLLFHNWLLTLIWIILVPVTGLFAHRFHAVKQKILGGWRLLGLVKKNREEAERLILQRAKIIVLLKNLLQEYII
ncbi:MAG: 1-acyl-sn-glycerol-3-phosphate acyltransferase [Bacteroidia bacterium]